MVFFLLIEVLLTRLTVSCDNWNELTCWISTAIRKPLSCYRACPGDPGLTIQAVSYAADTRSAWKRLCTPGYTAARGCLDFKPVQVARSRENGQAGAMVVADARAGRAAPCAACPQARRTRLQPGYIEISSLLYCDNCTLIGTGLEMTRPAYRLHIVSHKHWPFLAKIIAFGFFWRKNCWFEICCQCGSYDYYKNRTKHHKYMINVFVNDDLISSLLHELLRFWCTCRFRGRP